MAANFNNASWFYDDLAFIFYGKVLINAQVYMLKFIPANSNVLIVGGGTGWILEQIAKIHPSNLNITYVEVSVKMMARSKKRMLGNNIVLFINEAIEDVTLKSDYDVVITPFLLDNFTEGTLQKVFNHVHGLLKPGGVWLNTSFRVSGKWGHKILLKFMFLFFNLICKVEATKLPNIETQFEKHGYKATAQQSFFNNFIISRVYQQQLK